MATIVQRICGLLGMLAVTTACVAQDGPTVDQYAVATHRGSFVEAVQFAGDAPLDPVAPRSRENPRPSSEQAINDSRAAALFGSVDDVDALTGERRMRADSPASDVVFGGQAIGRNTADSGNLLQQAISSHGVATQNRNPLVSETRVRGQRVGQVLASGSYWAPARMDLDTMLNKLDSRLIQDMVLIKGPYSPRYGPGFRFVDVEFIQSPRYASGPQHHGSTSALFETNGQQFYGRQSFWGGSADSGYHVSYGHRTGNDYRAGENDFIDIDPVTGRDGFFLPASYKSRDLFIAYGHDLSAYETVEFNYLRLDQTDVEFPGLVFDLNFLVTDGYEITYTHDNPLFADRFTAEFWYNRTRFEGDNFRDGKARQQPFLIDDIGLAVTDGDALSAGYRMESTYDQGGGDRVSFGTDLIVLNQELNDIEDLDATEELTDIDGLQNYPIPRSHQVDLGYYAETAQQVGDWTTVTVGIRGDVVVTNASNTFPLAELATDELLESDLQQTFLLGSAFVTADVAMTRELTASFGAGYAQRPPTLTELYAGGPFIGSLQRGRTFLVGDPQLNQEQAIQLDYGLRGDYGTLRGGVHGFYAWVFDYLTFDLFEPSGVAGADAFGFPAGAALVNTDLATLAGAEMYGQADLTQHVSFFGTFSYVQGTDQTRDGAARQFDPAGRPRSDFVLPDSEALPGINPMETRVGFLIQDNTPADRWGVELSARIVSDQSRFAATLEEVATPGFTTYDIRTYVRQGQWLLTAGFENLTDKFYREHLDYRSGRGVFRPGLSFYSGLEVTY
ncbi:MAG: TonB-dependent receptor [Planctomycetota bacterium]